MKYYATLALCFFSALMSMEQPSIQERLTTIIKSKKTLSLRKDQGLVNKTRYWAQLNNLAENATAHKDAFENFSRFFQENKKATQVFSFDKNQFDSMAKKAHALSNDIEHLLTEEETNVWTSNDLSIIVRAYQARIHTIDALYHAVAELTAQKICEWDYLNTVQDHITNKITSWKLEPSDTIIDRLQKTWNRKNITHNVPQVLKFYMQGIAHTQQLLETIHGSAEAITLCKKAITLFQTVVEKNKEREKSFEQEYQKNLKEYASMVRSEYQNFYTHATQCTQLSCNHTIAELEIASHKVKEQLNLKKNTLKSLPFLHHPMIFAAFDDATKTCNKISDLIAQKKKQLLEQAPEKEIFKKECTRNTLRSKLAQRVHALRHKRTKHMLCENKYNSKNNNDSDTERVSDQESTTLMSQSEKQEKALICKKATIKDLNEDVHNHDNVICIINCQGSDFDQEAAKTHNLWKKFYFLSRGPSISTFDIQLKKTDMFLISFDSKIFDLAWPTSSSEGPIKLDLWKSDNDDYYFSHINYPNFAYKIDDFYIVEHATPISLCPIARLKLEPHPSEAIHLFTIDIAENNETCIFDHLNESCEIAYDTQKKPYLFDSKHVKHKLQFCEHNMPYLSSGKGICKPLHVTPEVVALMQQCEDRLWKDRPRLVNRKTILQTTKNFFAFLYMVQESTYASSDETQDQATDAKQHP